MSLFKCDKCGCVENTALSNYACRSYEGKPNLCSACDPAIDRWHERFAKESAKGMLLASDGFLYDKDYPETDNFKWRAEHQELKIVKVIGEANV